MTTVKGGATHGIRTAADIVNIHVVLSGWAQHGYEAAYIEVPGGRKVHVEGIGSTKASALQSWRLSVQTKLGSHAPQLLPPAQETAIRAKYRAQRQPLEIQEVKTKQEAQQKKERVREKYQHEREVLAKQLQDVRNQFAQSRLALDQKSQQKNLSEKRWTFERAKRELQAYRQANFATYLRSILYLQPQRPQTNSQGTPYKLSFQCRHCKTPISFEPRIWKWKVTCPSCGTKQARSLARP